MASCGDDLKEDDGQEQTNCPTTAASSVEMKAEACCYEDAAAAHATHTSVVTAAAVVPGTHDEQPANQRVHEGQDSDMLGAVGEGEDGDGSEEPAHGQ